MVKVFLSPASSSQPLHGGMRSHVFVVVADVTGEEKRRKNRATVFGANHPSSAIPSSGPM